jgi:hypothetical protein
VEPAHFDWRWRERPALALLAWEASARGPLARLRRIQVESIRTTLILGQRLLPIATSQHRPLLIVFGLALTAPVTTKRIPLPVRPLGINVGYHRLLTHGGFKCPKWLEHSLVTVAICCAEDTPARWVAVHRRHHEKADDQPDPHNLLAGFCGAIWDGS